MAMSLRDLAIGFLHPEASRRVSSESADRLVVENAGAASVNHRLPTGRLGTGRGSTSRECHQVEEDLLRTLLSIIRVVRAGGNGDDGLVGRNQVDLVAAIA